MRLAHLLSAALLALACATPDIHIPESEQVRSQQELAGGPPQFLRVASYVGPFWSDTEKGFLTDRPASEIDLVQTPGGKPIPPPKYERILPPGTPVRVQKIEFPTTFTMAERVLYTPRYHAWVYLQIEGDRRPYVIVLPREVKSAEDVRAELERYLATDDPRPALSALPPDLRELVLKKDVAPGMSARAVEMAWGIPDRKHIDRPAGTEDWYWTPGKRHVELHEDRVDAIDRF